VSFEGFFYSTELVGSNVIFVLDVSVNLQLWLGHAATNGHILPVVDPNTSVGFAIVRDNDLRDFSIQPFSARSWGGLSYYHADDSHQRLQFPAALPALCSQCLADANDGFSSLLKSSLEVELCHRGCEFDTVSGVDGLTDLRLRPTMQKAAFHAQQRRAPVQSTPANRSSQDMASTTDTKSAPSPAPLQRTASWQRERERSLTKFAADLGFYKDSDDLCVAQRPLPMLESVSTDCS
jgi:hypothetical protein